MITNAFLGAYHLYNFICYNVSTVLLFEMEIK